MARSITTPFTARLQQLASRRQSRRRRSARSFRPRPLRAECLEHRHLLSVVIWDGDAGDGLWNTAANWSTNVVPGANDDVTIDVPGDVTVTFSGGNHSVKSLENAENLVISSSGSFNVSGTTNNSGTVEVQSGILGFNAGGTSSGDFIVSAGRLSFLGTHELGATSSITGQGNVTLGYGPSTFAGTYNLDRNTGTTTVVGWDITGTVISVGHSLSVGGGADTNFHDTDIETDTVNVNGQSFSCGDLTTRELFWRMGTMSGEGTTTIHPASQGGLMEINGGRLSLDGRTLDNYGEATWKAWTSAITLQNGAVFNNHGKLDIQNDTSLGGDGTFNNYGELIKSEGTDWQGSRLQLPFNNIGGTVDVQSGTLGFRAGGTSSGDFIVSAGRLFFLGTHELEATSSITGQGNVTLGYGPSTFAGTYNLDRNTGTTTVSGWDITGTVISVGHSLSVEGRGADTNFHDTDIETDTVNVNGQSFSCGDLTTRELFWRMGTMSGEGTTTIHPASQGGLMEINGGRLSLDGRTLDNYGEATWKAWTSAITLQNGAVFNNHGKLDIQNDTSLSGDGTVNNYGDLIKSEGTDWSRLQVPFHNIGGTVDVQSGGLYFYGGYTQTAGDTNLNGGWISSSTPLDIQGGTLTGAGIVYGHVLNGGQTSPGFSPGIIQINGDYTQESTGSLDIEIGGVTAGAEYDQLDVNRTVTLDGALKVSLIGGFIPAVDDTFVIVDNDTTTDSVVGSFDGLPEGARFRVGLQQFEITYQGGDGNDVVLTAVNRPPVAQDQSVETDEDTELLIVLQATDPDEAPLSYTIVDDPDHGTLSGTAPNLTYTPNLNYNGPDSFTFKANDGTVDSNIATVSITVNPVNDAPALTGIPDVSFDEDGSDSSIDLDVYYSDVETLAPDATFVVVSSFSGVSASIDSVSHVLTIIGDPNFNGQGDITIRVTDTGDGASPALSAEDTLHVTVNPVNDAPVLAGIPDVSFDEDGSDSSIDLDIYYSDVETSAADATFVVVSSFSGVSATIDPDTHVLTVTADPDFNGEGDITIRVTDTGDGASPALSAEDTLHVTVNPVNDAPTASAATLTVTEDGGVEIDLRTLVSDVETDVNDLTFNVAGGIRGSAILLADGHTARYEVGASCDGAGSGSFTFAVTDRGDPDNAPGDAPLTSDPATVTVSITQAVGDGQVTIEDGVVRIGGTSGDDVILVSPTTDGQNVQVTINGTVVRDDIALVDVNEIRAWGRAGNDYIELIDLALTSMLHGGEGNDELIGAAGDDLIFGGLGNDKLTGAAGNDFLVGGSGADRIVGSAGHDILVAGQVACHFTDEALRQIMAEWAANKEPDDGLAENVLDETLGEEGFDMLTGSSGSDWFIVSEDDKITDFKKQNKDGDVVTTIP